VAYLFNPPGIDADGVARVPDWLIAHLLTIARLGAKGAFSTENTELIRTIVKRAPLTTKQYVEDHKSLFS